MSPPKPIPALVSVNWTKILELAFLSMIRENPDWRDQFFSQRKYSGKGVLGDKARNTAAFDLAVHLSRTHSPQWLLDMARRKLVEGNESEGYLKISPDLWKAGRTNRLLPHNQHLQEMKTNFWKCQDDGMREEWENWEDVAAVDEAWHDKMKKRCHYYFEIKDLYGASARAGGISTPATDSEPSLPATEPARSPSPMPALLKRDLRSAAMEEGPETSPKRARHAQSLVRLANLHLDSTSFVNTPSLSSSRSGSSNFVESTASPRTPFHLSLAESRLSSPAIVGSDPSYHTSPLDETCLDDDYVPFDPTWSAEDTFPQNDEPLSACTAEGSPAQPLLPPPIPVVSHPVPNNESATMSQTATRAAGVVGSSHDVPSLFGSLPIWSVQREGPSSRSSSSGDTKCQVLQEIDWTDPVYTNALLCQLYEHALYRSTLIPDRHVLPAGQILRPAWKVKRDLYVKIIEREPGQLFLLKLEKGGYVGKPGIDKGSAMWRATRRWSNKPEMVYDFGPRLRELQESWLFIRGQFRREHDDLFQPLGGAPSWATMMESLYGPAGEPVEHELASNHDLVESSAAHRTSRLLPQALFDDLPKDPDTSADTLGTELPSEASHPIIPDAIAPWHPSRAHMDDPILQLPRRPTAIPELSAGLSTRTQSISGKRAPNGSWRRSSISERPRNFFDMIHVARHRDFTGADLSTWRQKDLSCASSAEEQFQVFELGRADHFINGLLDCIEIDRPKKLYHKLIFDLQTIHCDYTVGKLRKLAYATGSRFLEQRQVATFIDHHKVKARFMIHLHKPSRPSLADQLGVDRNALRVVGLMEYLEYVARRFRLI